MNIPETDSKNLGDLSSLLDEADNGASGEPMTLHRRGHWFKSSIAHQGTQSAVGIRLAYLHVPVQHF